jgi:adenosylmethionine-8-amino-7-oxononanoate aminotransferase
VPGFSHIPAPDPYRYVPKDPNVSLGVAAANELEEEILRQGPDTVAAFIAEPIQGAGGVIIPPDDYFPRIRQICDTYGVLLIADDVITGFGRTGTWFGLEHWGIEPDIMQFAKGITSGYVPLGGIRRVRCHSRCHQQRAAVEALDARVHILGTSDLLRRGGQESPNPPRGRPGRAGGRNGQTPCGGPGSALGRRGCG